MYGDQLGELVCGYWGLKGNAMPNLSKNSSCFITVAESASGQTEANPVFWLADNQEGKMARWAHDLNFVLVDKK